jgi:hypothetical protein
MIRLQHLLEVLIHSGGREKGTHPHRRFHLRNRDRLDRILQRIGAGEPLI